MILIRFDTVPERRRAAGAAREEEVEGVISRHCGAVKGERDKQLRISIHHPVCRTAIEQSTYVHYDI